MGQQEYPSLNGYAPSWADIATSFSIHEGSILEMSDYSAIKFSDDVEVGEQRGASGGRRMLRTTGMRKEDASATLYRSGLRKLVKKLMEKAPTRGNQVRVGLVGFDITINHTPPGETEIYTVVIKGCRLLGRSWDFKEGNEAELVEVKLNPMEIVEIVDGKEVVLI